MSARRIIATLVTGLGLLAIAASPAMASQGIADFEIEASTAEAGAHPDIRTKFALEDPGTPEAAREVEVRMPEGFFGNPGAALRCSPAKFVLGECAPSAQVGFATVTALYEGDPDFVMGTSPLYNLTPRSSSETALLALVIPIINAPITIPVTVRTDSDYGLTLTVRGITQLAPLGSVDFEVWGVPAEPEHTPQRFHKGSPGNPPGCPGIPSTGCIPAPYPEAGQAPLPFTINPSLCAGEPLEVELVLRTYQDPDNPSSALASYPETTSCEKQRFDPVLTTALTSSEADSPSGLDFSLRSDQFLGPAPSPSQIRAATVTLPRGLSINPDAADGQTACLDSQAGFGTAAPSQCPDTSKIGTVEVGTPALLGDLTGSLFLGEPKPGNQYRVFMIFEGFGIYAKIAAEFHPDPETGQLTIDVPSLPQVPFEEFNLHLFASDRGLIATPTNCAVHLATATFAPWNDKLAPQDSRGLLSISSGPNGRPCPAQVRPFNPRLAAGASNPLAGAFSSFHLKLDRDDGDQFLGDLNFTMPPGFTGDLRGIPYCPEANIATAAQKLGRDEQANPSCPAPSQIGSTNVAAGPGGHPFNAVGKMYLSGPLRGAPLSLAAITPALAGPYDYGVVVVRVALHIDPLTAQVRALSETMPQIIGGIPIRMRSIQVNVDRERFTINPTNCDPHTVDSQGIGDQRTVTDFSSPFQAVNCATLPFKPRMTVTQIDRSPKKTRRNVNPRLRFDLFTRPGDANLRSVSVTLPTAFAIDQRHLGNICSKAQLEAELCAGRQRIGNAWVKTPLLDEPLQGPVYAVSGFGKLPKVAFILDGQVRIIPQAESSSVKAGKGSSLKTTVPVIPDAPVGHFRLTLLGGKQGYLVNTRDLCIAPARATIDYTAQSGKALKQRVRTKTVCPGGARKAKRAAKRSPRH